MARPEERCKAAAARAEGAVMAEFVLLIHWASGDVDKLDIPAEPWPGLGCPLVEVGPRDQEPAAGSVTLYAPNTRRVIGKVIVHGNELPDLLVAPAPPGGAPPLIDRICSGLDAELDEITHELFEAKVAARLAAEAFERGDLLEAAQQVRIACDREYDVLGECEHSGAMAEAIQRAHTGSDADYCDKEGCEVCAQLNADNRTTFTETES
jgi:hypothetical protein